MGNGANRRPLIAAGTALGIGLGREVHDRGIRSTVIYPGEINTPILENRPVKVSDERKAAILQPEDVASAVRACALPFGVSSVAQAAAVASLAAEVELLERVEALVSERARVVGALREQGWQVFDAQGNFVWLDLGEHTADFAAAAEEAGITVRPFAGEGVRVSIGERAGNDVFLALAGGWAPSS